MPLSAEHKCGGRDRVAGIVAETLHAILADADDGQPAALV